ncbi:MAG TPA: ACP S-malonyltransferase [Syntrophales bacterium]|nr:ACP S-malonyltransferase [Syntrophales bacterium]HPQ06668.1 ACP S-malonyltransferase [Syntrophales bacterium]HRS87408.1 ACP S-malonyltransferase [Syntrophales bacterium]
MVKAAFVFPGQGSQYVGMGMDVYGSYGAAREVFDRAGEILGQDIKDLCFRGPAEELNLTVNTQLAVLVTEIALYEAFRQEAPHVRPHYLAGHSLGEYAAIYAAGSLAMTDVVTIVRARARYHHEAVPVGCGAMAAVIGLEQSVIEGVCREYTASGDLVADLANLNAPGQTVISGHAQAVSEVLGRLKSLGAKMCVQLPISVPCHSRLMTRAADAFRRDLEGVKFLPFQIPVLPNFDPHVFHSPEKAAELLWRQMTSPVRWRETVERLASLGVGTVVEIGPKRVLGGLIKNIDRRLRVLFVGDVPSLRETAALISP